MLGASHAALLGCAPPVAAGKDDGEYRISDDGGATWSEWQTLKTLVLDRSLAEQPSSGCW
jgi:hypothetical protein